MLQKLVVVLGVANIEREACRSFFWQITRSLRSALIKLLI